jgi:hypothetical protein
MYRKTNLLLVALFLLFTYPLFSQDGMKFQDQYQVKIGKSKSPIKIDGILDESGWADAEEAKDFHMKWPNDIGRPTRNTFVKITFKT